VVALGVGRVGRIGLWAPAWRQVERSRGGVRDYASGVTIVDPGAIWSVFVFFPLFGCGVGALEVYTSVRLWGLVYGPSLRTPGSFSGMVQGPTGDPSVRSWLCPSASLRRYLGAS
jgi:hypothetical protein